MPAKISFFDMSILAIPSGPYIPLPVTLGPNWQPNDLRIFLQIAAGSNPPTGTVTPPGFTAIATASASSTQIANISYRRLVAGDTDTFIQYAVPSSTSYSSLALVTARGASPTVNPTAAYVTSPALTLPSSSSTGGSVTVTTLPVAAAGALLQLFFSYVAAGSAC